MENSEEKEECSAEDIRRKKLNIKLQKFRLRKSLNHHRLMGPSAANMNAMYEMRLQKLRMNNKALAKELAEKKIEIGHLCNDILQLKADLQEANERALCLGDKNYEKIIEQEVERRVKDIGDPLNEATNQAMNNLLGVVESFSKVKQLTGRFNSSKLSSSTISLPRSSVSRTPLGSCGNSSSPCQSVRPMVSGHVLQPAKVAIEKLDDVWKARLNARIQARENQLLDMSAIGEQSLSADEANDSTSRDTSLNTTDIPTTDVDSIDPNASSDGLEEDASPRSPSTPGRGKRGKQSRDNSLAASKSPLPNKNVSPTVSPLKSKDTEESSQPASEENIDSPCQPPQEPEDDPLEGSSWWYSESSQRGRGRGRSRSRGGKRGRPKSSARLSSPGSRASRTSVRKSGNIPNEDLPNKKSKLQAADEDEPKAPEILSELPDSPVLSIDCSYMASPATMLARLENLEEKSGRRSKSKSKGRSLRVSGAIADNLPKQQQEVGNAESRNETVLSKTYELHSVKGTKTGSSLVGSQSQGADESVFKRPLPILDSDFLIKDSDLTCIVDESMEMTEPISKILSQAAAAAASELKEPKDLAHKNPGNEKKFFKNDIGAQAQSSASEGKTPFDLSLMDDTYMSIPAYSSQKTVEKENMPPPVDDSTKTKTVDHEKEVVNLRRISIVLEDVMKSTELHRSVQEAAVSSPTYQKTLSPTEKCDNHDKSDLATESREVKCTSRKRRPLNYCSFESPKEEEDSEDADDNWSPNISKKSRNNGSRRSSQRAKTVSFSKKRDTRSEVAHLPTRDRRRTNKSESEITLAPATTVISAKTDSNEVNKKTRSERVSSPRNLPHDDQDDDVTKSLSECYVKICRTPVCEPVKPLHTESEDQLMLDELPDFESLFNESKVKDANAGKSENDAASESDSSESVQVIEDEAEYSKKAETATCDQVVPDQFEADVEVHAEDAKEDDKDVVAEAGDSRSASPDVTRESIAEANVDEESEAGTSRRRRGAAMKIASLKEPCLNTKMRNPGSKNSKTVKPKVKLNRKSGVKVDS